MFDSFYDYKYITKKKRKIGDDFNELHVYSFKGKNNRRYIVNVELYNFDVFVIKFYLKSHSDSAKKFNTETGFNEVQPIVRTCIEIMRDIYQGNEKASFGFIGSNSDDESVDNTKRFRVYSLVMKSYFSTEKFIHAESKIDSAYLLVNKLNGGRGMLNEVERMFKEIYSFR